MALIRHVPNKTLQKHRDDEKTDGGWIERKFWCAPLERSEITEQSPHLLLQAGDWKRQKDSPVRASWIKVRWHWNYAEGIRSTPYKGKLYWIYQGRTYETADTELTPEDVSALVNEVANRRRLQLEKARSLQAMTAQLDQKSRRQAIPQDVKIAVWQRDGGRCVECDAADELEFDHIIPLAMGGANTFRNLQLLCGTCNRRKGATLG